MMTMDITFYSTEGCFFCQQLKELFARANLSYTEIKVIANAEGETPAGKIMYQDFAVEHPGVRKFPFVIIDGNPVGGLVDTAKLLVKEGLVSANK